MPPYSDDQGTKGIEVLSPLHPGVPPRAVTAGCFLTEDL